MDNHGNLPLPPPPPPIVDEMYQVPTNNLPLSPLDDLPPPPPDIDGGYLGNNMYDVVPPPPPAMMNEGGAVVPETYEEKGELIGHPWQKFVFPP